MKLDSESAPNAFFHPLGGHSDEWYSNKKFHDPKPTPKDRPIGRGSGGGGSEG